MDYSFTIFDVQDQGPKRRPMKGCFYLSDLLQGLSWLRDLHFGGIKNQVG